MLCILQEERQQKEIQKKGFDKKSLQKTQNLFMVRSFARSYEFEGFTLSPCCITSMLCH